MTIGEQFIEAFKNVEIGTEFTSAEIKERVSQRFNVKKDSVMPSACCYNRWSKGMSLNKWVCLFEYVGRNKYKYWGKDYNYDGFVYREIKRTGELCIVGKWVNGVLSMK